MYERHSVVIPRHCERLCFICCDIKEFPFLVFSDFLCHSPIPQNIVVIHVSLNGHIGTKVYPMWSMFLAEEQATLDLDIVSA